MAHSWHGNFESVAATAQGIAQSWPASDPKLPLTTTSTSPSLVFYSLLPLHMFSVHRIHKELQQVIEWQQLSSHNTRAGNVKLASKANSRQGPAERQEKRFSLAPNYATPPGHHSPRSPPPHPPQVHRPAHANPGAACCGWPSSCAAALRPAAPPGPTIGCGPMHDRATLSNRRSISGATRVKAWLQKL